MYFSHAWTHWYPAPLWVLVGRCSSVLRGPGDRPRRDPRPWTWLPYLCSGCRARLRWDSMRSRQRGSSLWRALVLRRLEASLGSGSVGGWSRRRYFQARLAQGVLCPPFCCGDLSVPRLLGACGASASEGFGRCAVRGSGGSSSCWCRRSLPQRCLLSVWAPDCEVRPGQFGVRSISSGFFFFISHSVVSSVRRTPMRQFPLVVSCSRCAVFHLLVHALFAADAISFVFSYFWGFPPVSAVRWGRSAGCLLGGRCPFVVVGLGLFSVWLPPPAGLAPPCALLLFKRWLHGRLL
jgi:hypothetical protein